MFRQNKLINNFSLSTFVYLSFNKIWGYSHLQMFFDDKTTRKTCVDYLTLVKLIFLKTLFWYYNTKYITKILLQSWKRNLILKHI